jgi:hypothetical protein
VTIRRVLRRLRAAILVFVGLILLSFPLYVGYATWRTREVERGTNVHKFYGIVVEQSEDLGARDSRASSSRRHYETDVATTCRRHDCVNAR